MKIFVVNCGSSSMKYQLIDMDSNSPIAVGLCDRIGTGGKGLLNYKPADKEPVKIEVDLPDHTTAVNLAIKYLIDKEHGVISDLSEISSVGHRIVHGGSKFFESVLIDDAVIESIKECIPMSPLHNPANLLGIEAVSKALPNIPQVACFDTAFHQSMPDHAYIYPIPYELYENYGVRKYGFHGTSHRYVSARAIDMLGNKPNLRIVTCHLGNGSSCCAIYDGKSMDTSMGLTPLEGLAMGTRSGSIDPAIVKFLCDNAGLSIADVDNMLNKKSGVLGVSGLSNDFRDLEEAESENKRAALALEIFYYRVRMTIGQYAAALGGIDAIVFTAGIGENSARGRSRILKGLEFLGVSIDEAKNGVRGEEIDISTDGAKTRVLVIPTNEELMIALDTKKAAGL